MANLSLIALEAKLRSAGLADAKIAQLSTESRHQYTSSSITNNENSKGTTLDESLDSQLYDFAAIKFEPDSEHISAYKQRMEKYQIECNSIQHKRDLLNVITNKRNVVSRYVYDQIVEYPLTGLRKLSSTENAITLGSQSGDVLIQSYSDKQLNYRTRVSGYVTALCSAGNQCKSENHVIGDSRGQIRLITLAENFIDANSLDVCAHSNRVNSVLLGPYQETLISCSHDSYFKIYNLGVEDTIYSCVLKQHELYALSYSGFDSRFFIIGDLSGAVTLIDSRSLCPAAQFQAHNGQTLTIGSHPYLPNIFATGGSDSIIRLWDLRTVIGTFPQVSDSDYRVHGGHFKQLVHHSGSISTVRFGPLNKPQLCSLDYRGNCAFTDLSNYYTQIIQNTSSIRPNQFCFGPADSIKIINDYDKVLDLTLQLEE